MPAKFYYGGQAVIEGVMIRGRHFLSVAVRKPSGDISTKSSPLNPFLTGRLRQIPLLRGIAVLAETLVLGVQALSYSANVALEQEEEELPKWGVAGMIALSMTLGVGLFFLLPLFAVQALDRYFTSSIVSNLVEGIFRLAALVGYMVIIGMMRDIRRVFSYHGAEHMTVHAYEAGEPLEVDSVRHYSTAHARCGTAFLLVVVLVATIIFTFLGHPPMVLRILSRIVLLPVIASLSYEVIRFSGAHAHNAFVRILVSPSLALQALTTRQPDDSQIEVAIHAMKSALAADEGHYRE